MQISNLYPFSRKPHLYSKLALACLLAMGTAGLVGCDDKAANDNNNQASATATNESVQDQSKQQG